MKTVPIIVQNLDDEGMIKFMGRENLEDYNADFFVMFETWQAARTYLEETSARRHAEGESVKPTTAETTNLLGWMKAGKDGDRRFGMPGNKPKDRPTASGHGLFGTSARPPGGPQDKAW